jgi:hypothetical protein
MGYIIVGLVCFVLGVIVGAAAEGITVAQLVRDLKDELERR